jgi:hypothetical protein
MSRESVFAEDAIEGGVNPVRQGRLFQVANAVDLQRHPVAALGDVLCGLCVIGVGVVEQRRGEQRRKLNGGVQNEKEQPG